MLTKVLSTASATAVGGRNGHTKSDDGLIGVDLSVPKSMGGPGKPNTTTPEHLFAAGYSACFGGACEYQAKQLSLAAQSFEVTAEVRLGTVESGGFGLAVKLSVKVTGLSQADAEKAVAAGHEFCPYSRAIKGNVPVEVVVTVA
jgi:osmotically inducible protein OsmC